MTFMLSWLWRLWPLFTVAGIALAMAASKAHARRRRWAEEGVLVDGEIVGFQGPTGSDEQAVAPIVSYRDGSGESRQFTSAVAKYPNPYLLGQKVPVRWLAGDPPSVELDALTRSYRYVVAFGAVALLFLTCAALPFLVKAIGLSLR